MQGEGLEVGEGLSWHRKSLFKINTGNRLKTKLIKPQRYFFFFILGN